MSEKIHFQMLNYPKEDSLRIIRILFYDHLQTKLVRFIIYSVVPVFLFLTMLETYRFLVIFKLNIFVKYAPMYFYSFITILSAYIHAFHPNILTKLMHVAKQWKCNSQHLNAKIKKHSRISTCVILILEASLIFGCMLLARPGDRAHEMFYLYDLVEDYCTYSWCSITFGTFLMVYITFFFHLVACTCWQYIYAILLYNYQIWQFMEIEKLISELNLDQNSIRFYLKLLAKRYQDFSNVARVAREETGFFIFLYSIFFAVCFLSTYFYIISVEENRIEILFRILPVIFSGGLISLNIMDVGQNFENLLSENYDLLRGLNWYEWNKENKQIYLILLAQMREPLRYGFLHGTSMNYEMGTATIKAVYSFVSILRRMMNK